MFHSIPPIRTVLRSAVPRRALSAVLVAVPLALTAAVAPAAATNVKTTYERIPDDPTTAFVEEGKLTVAVTGISQNWDDIEIQVNPNDAAGTFAVAPSPPWTVDGIITRQGKKLLKLKRSSSIASDETVTVFHNDDRRRGRGGTTSLTLNNEVFHTLGGGATLLSAAAGGGRCDHGNRPAATVLAPYFEADLADPFGRTTLFALTNAGADHIVVRSILWTDWGVPTLTHYLAMSPGDVVTLNARDVMRGDLPDTEATLAESPDPPPGCAGAVGIQIAAELTAALLADHTGRSNPLTGDCAASDQGDGVARGSITFDVVDGCAYPPTVETWDRPEWQPSPSAPPGGFFGATATASGEDANVLTGDFFLVDPAENFAVGETLVPAPIDTELIELSLVGGGFNQTFYGGFMGFEDPAPRLPLDSLYRSRYLSGGAFDGGTTLVVWRDVGVTGFERAPCGQLPSWAPLGEQSVVAWDEDETSVPVPGGLGGLCPVAGQATTFKCPLTGATALPAASGFLDIDLWHGDGTPAQGWVMPVLEAEGRFSVGNAATPLDDMCETPGLPPSAPGSARWRGGQ